MSRAGLLYIPFEELNQVAVQRRINFNLAGESEGIHLYPERRTVSPRITRGPDGTLWIATMDGLATVYPGRRSVGTAPKALIERMYADGKRVSLAGRETAVVPGRQVQFEYTAIELTSSENLRFRYMLEGADKGWTDAGATRRVVYESLPPNRYRFRVAARSGLGPWEESGAAIAFRVPAGFYQTWWFFCACALTLGAGIFGLFRMRTLQLRYGLEMMYQERLRVTRELHDSLIQGFTGVVYQLDAALRSFDTSTGRTRDALRHALQQADQSLLDARHTITRLRLPALEKHSLPEAIRITAKELTEGGSISLSLDIEKSAAFLPYEIQSDLYMIARELLANAVNHSGASRIQLSLSCEERRFRMRVEDDGCGFDSAANPSEGHLGLTGCRERAKRIHALLKITSAPGKGTVADLHGTAVRRAADLNEGAAAIR
jgi:signal transduction histidine kinase